MSDREYTNGAEAPRTRTGSSSRVGPRGDPPAGRIYIGNLPQSADRKLVEDLFERFGQIVDVSVKRTISGTPFAFVEFADPHDAAEAIRERDGHKLEGSTLRVEQPFASRGPPPRNVDRRSGPFRPSSGSRRGEFRVFVKNLPASGSWQDLKDHMREAGECAFADVFRDGTGVVEFHRREDMEYALRHFEGSKFRSHEGETRHISVCRDDSVRPAYNGYREDRRYPPASYQTGPYRAGYDKYESRGYDSRGPPPRDGGYERYPPRRRSPSYPRRSRSRSRSFRGYR